MTGARAHNSDAIRHLYVHFPFCARLCPYCAFYKTRGNADDLKRFCATLTTEVERVSKSIPFQLETIFFGGGTPTVLGIAQLDTLLRFFGEVFDLTNLQEWTIESNPGSVSARKAAVLRRGGITRVSIGLQSWDNGLLRLLGREHDAEKAHESFRVFREAGFENISVDLMFALPGQTEVQWRRSLEKTIEIGPEHISTYCLTYEEDTEFLVRFQRGEFQVHDEIETRFFLMAIELLESAGYQHYETSNYARSGFRSRHNQAYWRGADYIGLGPSAFSTRNGQRWQNITDHLEYARRLEAGESPIASVEKLTSNMQRTERIALGLRTSEGIAKELINERDLGDLISTGLLMQDDGRFVLTSRGKLLADSIAEDLL
jgi:oxygen-independent coproporphyrinogen III oxidase